MYNFHIVLHHTFVVHCTVCRVVPCKIKSNTRPPPLPPPTTHLQLFLPMSLSFQVLTTCPTLITLHQRKTISGSPTFSLRISIHSQERVYPLSASHSLDLTAALLTGRQEESNFVHLYCTCTCTCTVVRVLHVHIHVQVLYHIMFCIHVHMYMYMYVHMFTCMYVYTYSMCIHIRVHIHCTVFCIFILLFVCSVLRKRQIRRQWIWR